VSSKSEITLPTRAEGHLLLPRLVAVGAALFWGVLFFGIIDLTVVLDQDERFFQHYLLETGWGLLYTFLVMVPLLLWALYPPKEVLLQQVFATGVAVVLAGIPALAVGQWIAGALVALSAIAPLQAAGRPVRMWQRWSVRGASAVLLTLAMVAVVASVVYTIAMVAASYSDAVDEQTWGLWHLPMQAGFGLALAGSAVVAVTANAGGTPGWRLAFMPAAVSAAWFGVVSMLYPDHLGSLGSLGGVACVCWGVALAAAALLVPLRTHD
jgi:hypothetical protein